MPRAITLVDVPRLLRSRSDLIELGMSDRAIARAVTHGELHRVRRGWFVSRQEWDDLWPEGKHLVHVVAVARDSRGSDPVLAGVSAAVLHELPLYRLVPKRVEQLIADPRHVRNSRDVMRHEGTLPSTDITCVGGVRVTTVERTLVDLARTVTTEAGLSAADASLRKAAIRRNIPDDDLTDAWRESMEKQLRDARGQRGIRQARWVIAFADGRAQLPGESVSRLQLHRLGLRDVDLQVRVPTPDAGNYWVDFGLNEFDVFGEFDGEGKYTDAALRSNRTIEQVMLDEKHREDWIRGTTGRKVIRWSNKHAASTTALAARLTSFGLKLPR
ncbi:MAG TPA: type IV toxin-antitoxin system AbiEi family antitoxin domain-containing protein [Humibacter sp.]|nr:type IV toxin-antitoxin system AbiEi family antitoxin domain-containing protein [Humibacter sp.]